MTSRDSFNEGFRHWKNLDPKDRAWVASELAKNIGRIGPEHFRDFLKDMKAVEKTLRKPVSVFLSHSHADKAFVRELGRELLDHGFRIWLDEAELKIGDSLISALSEAVAETDFLAAVISETSVRSTWVKKELAIALTQEVNGRRVKVLPILISKVTLPPYLLDKLYIDMSDSAHWKKQVPTLVSSLRLHHAE